MAEFGTSITADEIVDTLGFFDDWEDRYRYIIDLGKQLPELDAADHNDANIVRGCQSQVWVTAAVADGVISFKADSDAHIVRGLIAIVLSAFNAKPAQAILDFDIDGYFESLDLLRHISPTRGNGLRAMVARMRELATALQ